MAATNKAEWNVEQSSGTSSHLLRGLRPPHCITQVPGLHGYKNNWHKNPIFSLYLIIYLFAAAVIKYVHFEKEFGFLVSEVLPNYGCREMMCSACHKHGTKKKSKWLTGIEPVNFRAHWDRMLLPLSYEGFGARWPIYKVLPLLRIFSAGENKSVKLHAIIPYSKCEIINLFWRLLIIIYIISLAGC